MDQDQTPSPMLPLPAVPEPLPASSLGSRMMNVYTAPGDVFATVKAGSAAPQNWLVPVLLACLVGMISVWVIFSQEPILHQLREQRERAMAKQLEKLSKDDREKTLQMVERFSGPAMLKLFGSVGVVFSSFIWLFFVALVVWGLGRVVFKARFPYMKAVEMCGLAGMILVLGGIVTTLVVVSVGSITATPGPALLIREFQPANKLHQLASACNLITFWYTGVLAIGLGTLAGTRFWKAFAWLFGLWAVPRLGMILTGLASAGM